MQNFTIYDHTRGNMRIAPHVTIKLIVLYYHFIIPTYYKIHTYFGIMVTRCDMEDGAYSLLLFISMSISTLATASHSREQKNSEKGHSLPALNITPRPAYCCDIAGAITKTVSEPLCQLRHGTKQPYLRTFIC